jgi:hypothetical protein
MRVKGAGATGQKHQGATGECRNTKGHQGGRRNMLGVPHMALTSSSSRMRPLRLLRCLRRSSSSSNSRLAASSVRDTLSLGAGLLLLLGVVVAVLLLLLLLVGVLPAVLSGTAELLLLGGLLLGVAGVGSAGPWLVLGLAAASALLLLTVLSGDGDGDGDASDAPDAASVGPSAAATAAGGGACSGGGGVVRAVSKSGNPGGSACAEGTTLMPKSPATASAYISSRPAEGRTAKGGMSTHPPGRLKATACGWQMEPHCICLEGVRVSVCMLQSCAIGQGSRVLPSQTTCRACPAGLLPD